MKISQREARRNRKELHDLRMVIANQRSRWSKEFPGGVNITQVCLAKESNAMGRIQAAKMLGHAIVTSYSDDGTLYFYALPLPEVPA